MKEEGILAFAMKDEFHNNNMTYLYSSANYAFQFNPHIEFYEGNGRFKIPWVNKIQYIYGIELYILSISAFK